MAYEMIVALNVTDDAGYSAYRQAMGGLLAAHGGGFRYDFVVADVLRSDASHPINRVFAIYFADRDRKEAFFDNEEYKRVRKAHFDRSVAGSTIVAEYAR